MRLVRSTLLVTLTLAAMVTGASRPGPSEGGTESPQPAGDAEPAGERPSQEVEGAAWRRAAASFEPGEDTGRVSPVAPPYAGGDGVHGWWGAGLVLDIEACIGADCLRASEAHGGRELQLGRGDRGPVRVRAKLDCDLDVGMDGIARLAEVVLVPAGARTLECPLEPVDAHCAYRFWEHHPLGDKDVVARFFTNSVSPVAGPDADAGKIDEAEFALGVDWSVPAGHYMLIAALPEDAVDEFPCEEIRAHAWLQSPPLPVFIHDDADEARALRLWRAAETAREAGDARAAREALEELLPIADGAARGLLPDTAVIHHALAEACRALGDDACAAEHERAVREEMDAQPTSGESSD